MKVVLLYFLLRACSPAQCTHYEFHAFKDLSSKEMYWGVALLLCIGTTWPLLQLQLLAYAVNSTLCRELSPQGLTKSPFIADIADSTWITIVALFWVVTYIM